MVYLLGAGFRDRYDHDRNQDQAVSLMGDAAFSYILINKYFSGEISSFRELSDLLWKLQECQSCTVGHTAHPSVAIRGEFPDGLQVLS